MPTYHNLLVLLLLVSLASINVTDAKQRNKTTNKSKPKNPTQTFCSAFTSQCYRTAIAHHQGSAGKHVKVVYACRRNGQKYSSSFSFGCRADGVDITQDVLDSIGGSGYVDGRAATTTATVTPPTSTVTAAVSTTTSVTMAYTTTTTQVALGALQIPVMIVSVPNTAAAAAGGSGRRRAYRVDDSAFCSAFSVGCGKQCARVSSTPKHTFCQRQGAQASASSVQYRLTCYCKNGKSETQHALRAAAVEQHMPTVSTVGMATSTITVTANTPLATTKTGTATTTTTIGLVSTTKIVLAATGAVAINFASDNVLLGYLNKPGQNNAYFYTTDHSVAQTFFGVLDPASGILSLQHTDDGRSALVELGGAYKSGDITRGTADYGSFLPGQASLCGTAATKAAPADGAGPSFNHDKCEVFVFGAQLADAQSLNLKMRWVKVAQSTAQQFFWVCARSGSNIFATGDVAAFRAAYPAAGYEEINLRFPV